MAPVVPNPKNIRAFRSEGAFEAWLRANHARENEIWLRIYKKGAGKPTVTNAQALGPLYLQIMDEVRRALVAGTLRAARERLPCQPLSISTGSFSRSHRRASRGSRFTSSIGDSV